MVEHVLLSVHVLAGIVFVGGSAIATSLFPRYAPVVGGAAAADQSSVRNSAVASALHRITGGYAACAIIVPVVGIVLAAVQQRMGEGWITAAMILTAVAGGLLGAQIYPLQREALRTPDDGRRLRTLSMLAGIYNLLWTVVVVLMIVRPT
ncbi:hypothetical protein [Nocardia cyriacigeorgica]|jgi:uncharacterized membrane protein|uniref:hypothetical protein n=1 Tax=Nocardia cyriacigeorgica TaxID=135487 RepID=UPI0003040E26|nr:hypothetical protein [Nocardia cyriacigeorgica]